jgi:hypothetical protein
MRWLLLLLATAGFGQPRSPSPPAPAPLAHFRLSIERSDSGFRARCITGCTWTALSASCHAGCKALIDANGVYLNPATQPAPSPFAFRLEPTATGWKAESVRGTAWLGLSYSCGSPGCAAWVDEFGVRGKLPE